MKNKIYYLGWIGCLLTISGGLFKILHWPLAGILLTLGLVFLALVFFPAALRSNYVGLGKKKATLYVAIFLSSFLNIMGALFKIQHWPGGSIIMIAGILAPLVIFLPVYLYYHIKSEEQTLGNFFSILFLLVFISVMSALLSIRINKNIIDSSIQAITSTDFNEYSIIKKEVCYKHLLADSTGFHLHEISAIKQQSEALTTFIKKVQDEIVTKANNEESSSQSTNYWDIKRKDNADIPSFVLFNHDQKALELGKKIVAFRKTLLNSLQPSSQTTKYISGLLQMEDPNDGRPWQDRMFKNIPLVFALYQLNNLQHNITLAELETLNYLNKKNN